MKTYFSFVRILPLLVTILMPGLARGQWAWKPVSARQFVICPGEKSVLRWKAPVKPDAPDTLPCHVRGYDGKVVAELKATQSKGDVEVTVDLPRGFYTISFPSHETFDETFGLLVIPDSKKGKDTFFALDAALSVMRSISVRRDLISVMDRIGVSVARERVLWGDIQPKKDVWDWPGPWYWTELNESLRCVCFTAYSNSLSR